MPVIASVRPVLLSAPYAGDGNLEVWLHLPSGLRTTGLVETPEIERAFPFREEAVYRCLIDAAAVPANRWPGS